MRQHLLPVVVALHAGNASTDLFHGGVEYVLTTTGDEHRCALGRESLGGRETDAARSASDHHYFVIEPICHRLPL